MADITWVDVEAHYAALSTVDSQAQDDILDYVNSALNSTAFGGEAKYKLARIYLAAHMAELGRRGSSGAAGGVTSKTITAESLAVSYGGADSNGEALLVTAPGSALYWLIRSSPLCRVFVPRRICT